MAQAVGIRLLDFEGRDLAPGGAALLQLARIDMTSIEDSVKSAVFLVASDVDNPLVGPTGASAVYGPQKGASEEDVVILDRALRHFAAVVHRDLGLDLRDFPGAGAAGGLGAGLIAFLGARVRPGVEVVMEALALREEIANADLVVTGEGRFDEQSLRGKVAQGVLNAAREAGVEAIVLCGEKRIEQPGTRAFSMAERFGLEAALERPAQLLEELAADVAKDVVGDQPE
jgi:glycerate kinase